MCISLGLTAILAMAGCAPASTGPTAAVELTPLAATTVPPGNTTTPEPTETPETTPTPQSYLPEFEHIVQIVFENKEYGVVIGNPQMPHFNQLAQSNTLLAAHHAVTHPSLPNYLAMISGETFGLDFTCEKCLYDATTLPDLIEASGRTWKTYQEDMPAACYEGPDRSLYAMKHNPFMYFESIRLDAERCSRSVVPFTQLYADITAGQLPNYAFITPNLCHDAHDCDLDVADKWLQALMLVLVPALDATGQPYVVILTWDEGQGSSSCCGMPAQAGGQIATVLVSPQAKSGFRDDTPYTHYSVLKTIAEAWHLPYLGHAADERNVLITAPWN